MISVSQVGRADNRNVYNSAGWQQQPVVTTGGRQYTVWVDADRHPIVASRELGGAWSTFDLHDVAGNPLNSPVEQDGHNALSIAVDPNGHVHVAGNMHRVGWRYLISAAPHDIGGWDPQVPSSSTDVTYPKLVPYGDKLLVFYRDGASGNGDERLARWDGTTWTDELLLDGKSNSENPYLQRVVVHGGSIHVACVWRQTSDSTTNEDVSHMVSRDGTSWETMDGTSLALPVTHNTIDVATPVASGSALIGSAGMDVDANGRPHIVNLIDDSGVTRVLYTVRTATGWQDFLLPASWTHQMGTSPRDDSVASPHVVCHDSRVYLLTRNNVDDPGQVVLYDVTGGTVQGSGPVLDVDLYASRLPNAIDGDAVRMLATPTRTNDSTHPDYNAEDFSDQPVAVVTIPRTDLAGIVGGTVDAAATLESDTEPSTPGVSVAAIRRSVTWLGCDVTSGKIIAELPSLEGRVSRALGAETSSACSTPIPLSGPDAIGPQAFQATEPKRTMVVAVVNDVPAWAGIVLRRDGGTDAQLQLATISPEGYLNRRKVRDHRLSGVDEAAIMSTLAKDAEDIGGVGQGLGLIHDIQTTGQRRTRNYAAVDKVSVLQRMKELSRVIGGPEWTIDPEWADADKTVVQLVLRIAERIGKASDRPDAVFQATFDSSGAGASSYTLSEDHTDGRGANWVVAISTGEGDDRPESAPHIDQDQLDAGVPIFEHHFSPGSDIGQDTLNDHAAGELVRLKDGTLGLRITSKWEQYPRFGVDFRLGDDVAWDLVGHRHPDGFMGTGRLIGWELDLAAGTLSPTLIGIQNG